MAEESRSFTVPYGTNLTITATPDTGYELQELKFGEEVINSGDSKQVTDDITISATWTVATYTVTAAEGMDFSNITITINDQAFNEGDSVSVTYGESVPITVTFAEGYTGTFMVNGNPHTSGDSIQITGDVVLSWTVGKAEVTVTVGASDHGSISITDGVTTYSAGEWEV